MTTNRLHPQCPNQGELGRYALGTATEAEAEALAGHLDTCPDCRAAIERLEAQPDELQAALRGAETGREAISNPHVQQRVELMRDAGPNARLQSAAPSVSAAVPPAKAVTIQEFLERLAASGLWSEAELAALRTETDGSDPSASAEPLVRQLHQQRRLSALQAKMLWAGRGQDLVLGGYVLLDELGRGGMGVVYKAMHRRMKRLVAVKVLPAKFVKDPDLLQRFQREVEAAAQLTHPHVVTAYDAGESHGTYFLVMEFVNGRDLASVVKQRGPLPVDQAIDCVMQAARGLAYAHEQGVVHRDVKPSNLLLAADGTVKILDLGLARFSSSDVDVTTQAALTASGMLLGTVDYMAPEQAFDTRTADARSDVYSLGMTLYFLLTGGPPYHGDSMFSRLLAHRDAPVPSLRAARNDVPEPLEAVFARMVAKSADARPQTMTEVAAALDSCRSGGSGPPATAAAMSATAATASSVGAAAVSASVAGLGGLSSFLESLDAESAPSSPSVAAASTATSTAAIQETVVVSVKPPSIRARQRPPALPPRPRTSASTAPRRIPRTSPGPVPPWLADRRVLSGLAGAALLLLLGIVLLFRTSAGTLRVEIHDPAVEVRVKGTTVVLTGADPQEIELEPGEKTLIVKRGSGPDAFEFETRSLTLKKNQTVTATVELLDGEIQVVADGKEIGRGRPASKSATVAQSKDAAGPERRAAEWVLSKRKTPVIVLRGETRETVVRTREDIPDTPFAVVRIDLWGLPVLDEEIGNLEGLSQLKSLSLHGSRVTDAVMPTIGKLRWLTFLDINSARVTDAGLDEVVKLKDLAHLSLTLNPVTDAGIAKLVSLEKLQYLSIAGTPVTDASITHLASLPELRALVLNGCNVRDAGFSQLSKLRRLEEILATNCPVTSAALPPLAELRELRKLHLSGTRIDDAAVEHLARLQKLELLDVSKTLLSLEGLAKLRAALPRCTILPAAQTPPAEPAAEDERGA